ncbi:aminomethyltransferase [Angulomicrobium tetraedrale]|uniref:Aminomethyltransferase n=1 Tax=Ancylobacter tetraedralis TaxID=217068 RepID=A0A839Z2Q1_9HYPH|nr:aminomethyltransferase family protein [Ancylobacter tetraedralis]MBB3769942.1 aminomethyltransferase [Ancylobacter tetraedralis]
MNIQLGSAAPAARRINPARLRHVAPGGSFVRFEMKPGDRAHILDPEGGQAGLLIVAGLSDPLPDLLAGAVPVPGREAVPEAARAFLGTDVSAFSLFSPEAAAGSAVSFTAPAPLSCVLLAPGGPMDPGAQDAPTDLIVEIEPAIPSAGTVPPPLAEPKLDLRIRAASASAYEVKAGDYIQIIDVDGQQCSDFLAFDAAKLRSGREKGLDPTTTRTLMGSASPGPGLHSKYYDEDQTALVEVIRDTVGRHDTFMLACNAKYYEDMGYPGHDNCTDNFNRALTPYGIAPKMGWPAVNFFYNTFLSPGDRIGMDEPWSRPGDYVLLRALTDLVCASSSCADDVDASNAWHPTDIHVRVYDGANHFSRGIAHRMTPDSAPRLTRETAFHARTSALTRKFTDYRGFWLPDGFNAGGPIEEYWACRERAVVMDLSALRKFEILGPDAEKLVQLAVTRDIRKLAVGQVVYTALCYEHGGMLDDGTVFRLAENNFRLVCGDDYCGVWLRELAAKHGLHAFVKSSTDQLHNLALQGPKSRDILREILVTPAHQPSADELRWFRFTIGKIGDTPVMVSRTGYTGELGYEIWCHPSRGVELWDAILQAGAPHGLEPLGLLALDMLRIEAGLAFAGYEFCDQTDPFEAGIGFTVPESKPDDFVGKQALDRRRAHPARKLVGLTVAENEPVHHGDPVYNGRAQIGIVTSATRSPILGSIIALARLDVSAAEPGAGVEIGKLDGHQKRLAATIVAFPHYDPTKSRVRA